LIYLPMQSSTVMAALLTKKEFMYYSSSLSYFYTHTVIQ